MIGGRKSNFTKRYAIPKIRAVIEYGGKVWDSYADVRIRSDMPFYFHGSPSYTSSIKKNSTGWFFNFIIERTSY